MTVMSLSALQKTGQFVSVDMFGANAVFAETSGGAPTAAYASATQALGAQNIRFGGGQADLDPQKANAAGEHPIDGETAINIVDMPGGTLRPEVATFLDWCRAQTAEGHPVKSTLIIPTKHLGTADYDAFGAEIEVFVQTVTEQYADVIAAFQIGNEYWEMGETAYGIKASIAAVAIEKGLVAAGMPEQDQPDILVQMATAGNQGSEFPAVPGVSDFQARNTAANERIIEHLSDSARSAIDGVTEHYYYNRTDYAFLSAETAVKNINRDYDVWAGHFGNDLDLHITEWNIKTSATAQHGIVAASTLIKQFENMIEIGVDGAHIWALDYHSRTAPTLRSDEGAFLDTEGRLTNSAQGAAFDLMSDALVGKELVTASFLDTPPEIEVTSYASETEIVFYVSSRSFEQSEFSLNLATKLPNHGPIEAVQIAIDPETSNGLQWQRGVAAESVLIDGQPYFYNEHDVDVILTDTTFADASQIDLMLNPFEVVQLTMSLVPEPALDLRQLPASAPDIGTAEDDLIAFTTDMVTVDGAGGLDTLVLSLARDAVQLRFDAADRLTLTTADQRVEVIDIERLVFSDGTLALDIDGTSGQAYRLYKASFDRDPDNAGLKYWIEQLDQGMTLQQAAALFLGSVEFQAQFGTNAALNDATYVDLLYANVLDRAPDEAGYAFWQMQQDTLSPEELLVAFSESEENKMNVAIDDGIWIF